MIYPCSYSDVAIYLYMMRGAGAAMATHQLQTPGGATVTLPDAAANYRNTVPILDLLRGVTPLAWGRWITAGGKTGTYGPATAALYGNNKEWCVRTLVLAFVMRWARTSSLSHYQHLRCTVTVTCCGSVFVQGGLQSSFPYKGSPQHHCPCWLSAGMPSGLSCWGW